MARKAEPGQNAVDFIQDLLRHTKDPYAGQPFLLKPWQERWVRDIFGTFNADGSRQYRTAYVEIPRKNGKSEIAAAVALYLLFADGELGAEIYSAAGDREQASIVFNVAAAMVRQEPILNGACRIYDSTKKILVPATNSIYQVLSAEHSTKHGFNASGIIFDELHAQPSRDLWDVLTTSGGTRRQPLIFAITTAGYDQNSICWEQHEYARKVAEGVVNDPTFYPVLFSAPQDADWTDPEVWKACNPALGDFRDYNELAAACERAKEVPAYENTFRRLYLNQWVKQESRYLPMMAWDACDGSVDAEALRGRQCWAGLDLASSVDVAAFVLAFEGEGEEVLVLPYFWVPAENIGARARTDKVPYDVWARQGLLKATPGNVIDYATIRHDINELSKVYEIREVAFDRWGAVEMSQNLTEDGFTMVDFGQGFKDMSPPTKELLKKVLGGKLRHGGHPILRWMADNLVVGTDPAENVKPLKNKSTERIDGMVALIMALARLSVKAPGSVYSEERGIIAL